MKDMSFSPSRCKEAVVKAALESGFYAVGVARAGKVRADVGQLRERWLENGLHGCLGYMERYSDLRGDPRLLMPGCRSVIVMAMPYYDATPQAPGAARIARYARGDDYHEVLRELAAPVAAVIGDMGFATRICVDTAPIAERYWAVEAGVGFIGRNSTLIIPDAGSWFFLCEILTDAEFPADEPCRLTCIGCDRCVKACPAQAILPGPLVDARRCLSCLTIEYRGDFPDDISLGDRVFGCDTCQQVCPHNASPVHTAVDRFMMRQQLATLTADEILAMSQLEFSTLFSHSAVKRTKLTGLQRNAAAIKRNSR